MSSEAKCLLLPGKMSGIFFLLPVFFPEGDGGEGDDGSTVSEGGGGNVEGLAGASEEGGGGGNRAGMKTGQEEGPGLGGSVVRPWVGLGGHDRD